MRILVIGYGSIGKRHANLLSDAGHDVTVLSGRAVDFPKVVNNLPEALAGLPEYIIIASETSSHFNDLDSIHKSGFTGKVLVEKPLFDKHINVPEYGFDIYVAYNLRFHPIIQSLNEHIEGKKILSVHYYVGQHLSTWRKERNHLDGYSAHKNRGGGVLRDLSHEIDMVQYLFGKTKSFVAKGGRYGDVTVDSEDAYAFIFEQEKCPLISMQMNYLDHVPRREIIVNTTDTSYKADLMNKDLWINGEKIHMDVEANVSYLQMHNAILEDGGRDVCSLAEGLNILSLIERIEK